MLKQNSPLGFCGIYEWLIVRISAVIIFLYIIYVSLFFMIIDNLTYDIWYGFFKNTLNKIITIITLLSVMLHSWIGMWQIITDYIRSSMLQLASQMITLSILMTYFFYGLFIIWRL